MAYFYSDQFLKLLGGLLSVGWLRFILLMEESRDHVKLLFIYFDRPKSLLQGF